MRQPPDILEQYLHDINVLEDDAIEAKYYTSGIAVPRYPMPALIQDSQSDLAKRWSNWLDDDRLSGHKY